MLSTIVNIVLFLLVIGILVFVHELGHFLAAKSVNATIYEFALGFGPRILSKEHKGIIYAIRLIPFGGFVKIAGDGDPSTEEGRKEMSDPNSLKKKTKIAQVWVMLAGVLMNLLLATTIYYIVLWQNDWQLSLTSEFENMTLVGAEFSYEKLGEVEYQEVLEGSGAEKAGIPESGYIREIDGKEIEYSSEISEELEGFEGKDVIVDICTEGDSCEEYTIAVSDKGQLGISLFSNYILNLSYADHKVFAGFSHVANMLKLTYTKLGTLFSEAKETGDYTQVANTFTGPVGIYLVLDYFKQFGIIALLSILGDISLSLAIMNLLPIPALDGGRVLILIIESILGKDLNEKVEAIIINVSFVLLILLTVVILIKDFLVIDSLRDMFS